MKYDLKVGYACNNKCFHCVVETNRMDRKTGEFKEFDYKYGEILKILEDAPDDTDDIVITGGEPTVRKDFVRLVRQAKNKSGSVSLQTNGRLLGKYAEQLHAEDLIAYYVIAVHGFEKTHNEIAGNVSGNPYQETMDSLKKLKEVYGEELNERMRLELVLSSKNLDEFVDFIEYMFEQGYNRIGVSYPHLDGFAYNIGIDYAKQIGFSYAELSKHIPRLFKLFEKYPESIVMLEMVPNCVLKDEEGNHLYKLPKNYRNMSLKLDKQVIVNYPNTGEHKDFIENIRNDVKHFDFCSKCIHCCDCIGVWSEYVEMFGSEGLSPVK